MDRLLSVIKKSLIVPTSEVKSFTFPVSVMKCFLVSVMKSFPASEVKSFTFPVSEVKNG